MKEEPMGYVTNLNATIENLRHDRRGMPHELGEYFADDFMQRMTKFKSWEDMLAAYPGDAGAHVARGEVSDEWQQHVRGQSSCTSWENMVAYAVGAWRSRHHRSSRRSRS
jgi:hypothetical protein